MTEEKRENGEYPVDLCEKILVSPGMTEDELVNAAEETKCSGKCQLLGWAPMF